MSDNHHTQPLMTGLMLLATLTSASAWSGVIPEDPPGLDDPQAVEFQLAPRISTQKHAGGKAPDKSKPSFKEIPDTDISQADMPTMQIRGNNVPNPKFKPMPSPGSVQIRSNNPGVQLQGHTQMDTGMQGGVQHKSQGRDNNNDMNIGGMQNK
ncbi:MAG: hypothetical protein HQM03_01270 [Magnetococcales bacterium]|nr:hypothetical protein [Magnetococcales bacterium]